MADESIYSQDTYIYDTNYGITYNSPSAAIDAILQQELLNLDGINRHNPETGEYVSRGLLDQYTNRLFGAPFQLLDSVDKRFGSINGYVGSEYLRNFLLNSAILHVKPGMPRYEGAGDSESILQDLYMGITLKESIINKLVKKTIFGKGGQIQRRMFGFRETYMSYMSHVNYMCRSVAGYLGLTGGDLGLVARDVPQGCFATDSGNKSTFTQFSQMRWENYRMFNTYVQTVSEYAKDLLSAGGKDTLNVLATVATKIPIVGGAIQQGIEKISGEPFVGYNETKPSLVDDIVSKFIDLKEGWTKEDKEYFEKSVGLSVNSAQQQVDSNWTDEDRKNSTWNLMNKKVKSVAFMVKPVSFTERIDNETSPSLIHGAIDALDGGMGAEIAFVTGSHADVGVLGEATKFIGGTVTGLATNLSSLIAPLGGGGFVHNLFSGAMGAIKGQRMIYPEIYRSSRTTLNHEFEVTLSTPYGDIYNYYMNIVVPLMHLIALSAPRMISSNSVASPFLIQCYIPGMATCQLGIIDSMTITKNPNEKHVSVNGFPLSIKVNFSVKELYNALAISAATDPAAFMWNETLNDYLTNLAGLIPSASTYLKKRGQVFESMEQYFHGEIFNDITAGLVESWENRFMTYR